LHGIFFKRGAKIGVNFEKARLAEYFYQANSGMYKTKKPEGNLILRVLKSLPYNMLSPTADIVIILPGLWLRLLHSRRRL